MRACSSVPRCRAQLLRPGIQTLLLGEISSFGLNSHANSFSLGVSLTFFSIFFTFPFVLTLQPMRWTNLPLPYLFITAERTEQIASSVRLRSVHERTPPPPSDARTPPPGSNAVTPLLTSCPAGCRRKSTSVHLAPRGHDVGEAGGEQARPRRPQCRSLWNCVGAATLLSLLLCISIAVAGALFFVLKTSLADFAVCK